MNRFSQLIFLAGFLSLGFSVCAARESPGHGMYVWERAVSMTDGGADDRPLQIEMLEFCRRSAIDVRRIYFLVDFERADPASLSNLLRRAQRYDVEIFALHPGSLQNEWAREFRKNKRCDHDVVLRWVDRVLGFGSKFDGIQLDIELHTLRPHRRRLWRKNSHGLRNKRNRRLAQQYIELLDRIREYDFRLAATLPVWLDDPKDYAIKIDGRKAPLSEHIQDRVDFVTLMNYVADDSPASIYRAVRNMRDEIKHGPVESMFETQKPGRGAAGKASTLYRGGLSSWKKLCRELDDVFGSKRNYLGCAAHHYGDGFGGRKRRWKP
jgi:hypothetical protein